MAYYLIENGIDRYQLEDASGLYLMEVPPVTVQRRTLTDYVRVGSRVARIILVLAILWLS